MTIFAHDREWLKFVLADESLVRDSDGRLSLSQNQKKAAEFLGDLYASDVPVVEIPLFLAEELFALDLSGDELHRVINDLSEGPKSDGPVDQPPSDENPGYDADVQTLSFLLDHSFSGSIDPKLIVSAEVAMASSFFSESMAVFDELSFLGQSQDDYAPKDDDIIDAGENGSLQLPNMMDQPTIAGLETLLGD